MAPPKGSQKEKVGTAQTAHMKAFTSALANFLKEIGAGSKAGGDETIVTTNPVKSVVERFRIMRKNAYELPVSVIENIVECINNNGRNLCNRLQPDAISIIIDILLHDGKSLAAERGVFLIAHALYGPQKHANQQYGRGAWKGHIGKGSFRILAEFLLDNDSTFDVRRWVGLLCIQLFRGSSQAMIHLEQGPDDLRQAFGPTMINDGNEIIRVILGQLIRDLMERSELQTSDFFPQSFESSIYEEFPKASQGNKPWGWLFDGFLDRVAKDSNKKATNDWFFGSNLTFEPDILFGLWERSAYILFGDLKFTIMTQETEHQMAQILDVQYSIVQEVSVVNVLADSFAWILLRLKDNDSGCHLDTIPVNMKQIRYSMERENAIAFVDALRNILGDELTVIETEVETLDTQEGSQTQIDGNLQLGHVAQSQEIIVVHRNPPMSPEILQNIEKHAEVEESSDLRYAQAGAPSLDLPQQRQELQSSIALYGLSQKEGLILPQPNQNNGDEDSLKLRPLPTEISSGEESEPGSVESSPSQRKMQPPTLFTTRHAGSKFPSFQVVKPVSKPDFDPKLSPAKLSVKKAAKPVVKPKAKNPIVMKTVAKSQTTPASRGSPSRIPQVNRNLQAKHDTKPRWQKSKGKSTKSDLVSPLSEALVTTTSDNIVEGTGSLPIRNSAAKVVRQEKQDILAAGPKEKLQDKAAIPNPRAGIFDSVDQKPAERKRLNLGRDSNPRVPDFGTNNPNVFDLPEDGNDKSTLALTKASKKTRKSAIAIQGNRKITKGIAKKKRQSAPAKFVQTATRQSQRGAAAKATDRMHNAHPSDNEETEVEPDIVAKIVTEREVPLKSTPHANVTGIEFLITGNKQLKTSIPIDRPIVKPKKDAETPTASGEYTSRSMHSLNTSPLKSSDIFQNNDDDENNPLLTVDGCDAASLHLISGDPLSNTAQIPQRKASTDLHVLAAEVSSGEAKDTAPKDQYDLLHLPNEDELSQKLRNRSSDPEKNAQNQGHTELEAEANPEVQHIVEQAPVTTVSRPATSSKSEHPMIKMAEQLSSMVTSLDMAPVGGTLSGSALTRENMKVLGDKEAKFKLNLNKFAPSLADTNTPSLASGNIQLQAASETTFGNTVLEAPVTHVAGPTEGIFVTKDQEKQQIFHTKAQALSPQNEADTVPSNVSTSMFTKLCMKDIKEPCLPAKAIMRSTLLDDYRIRKQTIISFNANGAQNQGTLSTQNIDGNSLTECLGLPEETNVQETPSAALNTQPDVVLSGDGATGRCSPSNQIQEVGENNTTSAVQAKEDEILYVAASTPPRIGTSVHHRHNQVTMPARHSVLRRAPHTRSQRSSQTSRVIAHGSPISDLNTNIDNMDRLRKHLCNEIKMASLLEHDSEVDKRDIKNQDIRPGNVSPHIHRSIQPKARPASPSRSESQLIAHTKIENGAYRVVGAHDVVQIQTKLADPFSEGSRRTTTFIQRLLPKDPRLSQSQQITGAANTLFQALTPEKGFKGAKRTRHPPQVMKSYGSINKSPMPSKSILVTKPEQSQSFTGLRTARSNHPVIHKPVISKPNVSKYEKPSKLFNGNNQKQNYDNGPDSKIHRNQDISPGEMTSGSLMESSHGSSSPGGSNGNGVEEIAWNNAIRPHYQTAYDAIHRIADELIIQLASEEDRMLLLSRDYKEKGEKVLSNFERHQTLQITEAQKILTKKSEGLVKFYENFDENLEVMAKELRDDPITAYEEEWETSQVLAHNKIVAGMKATG